MECVKDEEGRGASHLLSIARHCFNDHSNINDPFHREINKTLRQVMVQGVKSDLNIIPTKGNGE